jgi:DNA-binding HxlR family transcriptional regulator
VTPGPPSEIPPCGCSTPGTAAPANCYCSVENLLRVIRRRYSLAVMNAIQAHRPARYRDLAATLPAASSSTLVETLGALEAAQLIRRHMSETPPLSSYELTGSGAKLLSRLRRLLQEIRES